jgi:hypothetical protein
MWPHQLNLPRTITAFLLICLSSNCHICAHTVTVDGASTEWAFRTGIQMRPKGAANETLAGGNHIKIEDLASERLPEPEVSPLAAKARGFPNSCKNGFDWHLRQFNGEWTTAIRFRRPKISIHGHQHIRKRTKVEETLVIGAYGAQMMELPG